MSLDEDDIDAVRVLIADMLQSWAKTGRLPAGPTGPPGEPGRGIGVDAVLPVVLPGVKTAVIDYIESHAEKFKGKRGDKGDRGEVGLPGKVEIKGNRMAVARQPDVFTDVASGVVPASGGGSVNFLRADGTWVPAGGGLSDGDKGDITVSGSGAVWTIDPGVVTYAKMQDISGERMLGKPSAGAGDIEEMTGAAVRSFAGAEAAGTAAAAITAHEAAANPHPVYLTQAEGDGFYSLLGHTHTAANITDFSEAVDDQVAVLIQNGGGITWTYNDGLNTLTPAVTITSGQVSDFTEATQDVVGSLLTDSATINYTYDDGLNTLTTAVITTGLDLFTDVLRGVVPPSGGGTANFLRADGVFAAPPGGGGGASATTVEVNTGATATWNGRFTITDANIGATSKVMCWQAPGPYTGKGSALSADEGTLDPITITAVIPASGSAVAHWETKGYYAPVRRSQENGAGRTIASVGGEVEAAEVLAAPAGGRSSKRIGDIVAMQRIGKVKGNIKFSYVVFS